MSRNMQVTKRLRSAEVAELLRSGPLRKVSFEMFVCVGAELHNRVVYIGGLNRLGMLLRSEVRRGLLFSRSEEEHRAVD